MRLAHAGSPFNRIESPIQQIGNPESGRERHALEPIGNIPPAEAEAKYYAALDQPAVAA
jgi:hypothetical protein